MKRSECARRRMCAEINGGMPKWLQLSFSAVLSCKIFVYERDASNSAV